jgi:3-deoxy-D-manno-octulosonate 8-phosphate phosphatase (KDO 8-P phosphatase)
MQKRAKGSRGYFMTIKLILIDVDGTLTDGLVHYGDNNHEIKSFNIKDGAAIKSVTDLGIDVIFFTGRTSAAVERRASELGVVAVQGVSDKASVLSELRLKKNVTVEHCAYIGDDLNDYAAMKMCGFKACPADAASEIREICDFVSSFNGGNGAVREIIEHILRRDGRYEEFLSLFGAS